MTEQRIQCERCGKSLKVPSGSAGKKAKCSTCSHTMVIAEAIPLVEETTVSLGLFGEVKKLSPALQASGAISVLFVLLICFSLGRVSARLSADVELSDGSIHTIRPDNAQDIVSLQGLYSMQKSVTTMRKTTEEAYDATRRIVDGQPASIQRMATVGIDALLKSLYELENYTNEQIEEKLN
ncbi:zinc-ribbon domain-containing protein [Planctomycetaceae bacterium]|nr:zinc-ribbon domain-containing protein [Planctomycetaceae bacterium]